MQGSTVFVGCVYAGQPSCEMRSKLRLRTRTPGWNNRMDVQEIFTYDRVTTSSVGLTGECSAVLPGWQPVRNGPEQAAFVRKRLIRACRAWLGDGPLCCRPLS